MTDAAPTCRDCGAFVASTICPVCQQFAPPARWRLVLGAALLSGLVGAVALAGFIWLLNEKWARWLQQFGETDSPPAQADALDAAATLGLLVFAVVSTFTALVLTLRLLRTRRS